MFQFNCLLPSKMAHGPIQSNSVVTSTSLLIEFPYRTNNRPDAVTDFKALGVAWGI